MKQILLDNAYEAWANAIFYHNEIEKGLSFLSYKKGFVSSLHNAVELFMKQILIDKKDRSVVTIRKPINGQIKKLYDDYHSSTDLNLFFESIDFSNYEYINSIGFDKLINRSNEILDVSEKNINIINEGLNLLKNLRNFETHFYINTRSYLIEKDFCLLHNFMIIFFNIILDKGLFKKQPLRFQHEPKDSLFDFQKELDFTKDVMDSFSYEKALINNNIAISIANYINDNTDLVSHTYSLRDSFYELGWYIKSSSKVSVLDDAIKNYKTLLLLDEYGLIKKETNTVVEYNYYNDDAETIELTALYVQL